MIKVCDSCKGLGERPTYTQGNEKCYACGGIGFECLGSDEIVCPYCGEEKSDSWEVNDSGIHECGHCTKKFLLEVEFSKSFSSGKADCLNKAPHKLSVVGGYEELKRGDSVYRYCRECRQYLWVTLEVAQACTVDKHGNT